MTSIKNHKTPTILVAIAALAGVLVVSTVAIGNERIALATHPRHNNIIKHKT